MKSKVTCAVVIIDGDGTILGCHATGRPPYSGFDFPKGLVEEGEEHIDAALRELKEETGIVLTKEDIIDCGLYKHNKEKDIHIFMRKTDILPPVEKLKCTTYFKDPYGTEFPEADTYRHIKKNERYLFNQVLHNKFDIIDKFNNRESLISDKEKLYMAVRLADAMYDAAKVMTTDASRLRKAMDAWWNFRVYELNK